MKPLLPIAVFVLAGLLGGCSALPTAPPPGAFATPLSHPSAMPTATSTPTVVPTSSVDLVLAQQAAILYKQDFEKGASAGIFNKSGSWSISLDDSGNHIYCNDSSGNWQSFQFGFETWMDYAVEMHVELLDENPSEGAEVYSRIDSAVDGYRGSLYYMRAALSYNPPQQNLGGIPITTKANTWYVLRIEAAGSRIKFYADNQLIADVNDGQRSMGMAGFGVSPNTKACVDDIRVWALTNDGRIGQAPTAIPVSQTDLEVVTSNAATGDGGNSWGGHQTRIVRTRDGIFTAYTVEGGGYLDREWRLAWRQGDGSWLVVAQGVSGKDPVNLLASPDGTLHVIGWPNGIGTMWSGKPRGKELRMTEETIPGVASSNWPYSSAGVDASGNICILSTQGAEPGVFQWACFLQHQGSWISRSTSTDYGFRYTYVFPRPDGGLLLVSTRDVLWGVLGYTQPPNTFDYVFNAFGYWQTDDIVNSPLKRVFLKEEQPTAAFPYVILNAQEDAYLDTAGNMHVLYHIQGESTQGAWITRHAILSPKGEVLNDVKIPEAAGDYSRIFQDARGRFYILGSSGLLYPAGIDGVTLGTPVEIDLKGYIVEYSGFGISVPRTGTAIGNVLGVVFPSDGGTKWIYFQLTLPDG